jgi:hypothetical protein
VTCPAGDRSFLPASRSPGFRGISSLASLSPIFHDPDPLPALPVAIKSLARRHTETVHRESENPTMTTQQRRAQAEALRTAHHIAEIHSPTQHDPA